MVRTRGMKHESRQRSAGGDLLHHSVISLRSRWRKQRSAGPRSTHAQVALGLTDTNVGNGSVGYRVRTIYNSAPLACHKISYRRQTLGSSGRCGYCRLPGVIGFALVGGGVGWRGVGAVDVMLVRRSSVP